MTKKKSIAIIINIVISIFVAYRDHESVLFRG